MAYKYCVAEDSGNGFITARERMEFHLSGCGTQAAGLFAGGGVPPYQQTEEFTIGGTPSVETIDVP